MSIVYDGSHSITFTKGEMIKNTWSDWHLIPASRPFINPPAPAISMMPVPGSSYVLDNTEMFGLIDYSMSSGDWEFYIDNNNWDDWLEAYNTVTSIINGARLNCILEDDPLKIYSGRFSISAWKNGDSYSSITIHYDISGEPKIDSVVDIELELDSNALLKSVQGVYYSGRTGAIQDYETSLDENTGIVTISKDETSKRYLPGLVDIDFVSRDSTRTSITFRWNYYYLRYYLEKGPTYYYINQIFYDGTIKKATYNESDIDFEGYLNRVPASRITFKYLSDLENGITKTLNVPISESKDFKGVKYETLPDNAIGPIYTYNESFLAENSVKEFSADYDVIVDPDLIADIMNDTKYYLLVKIYEDCDIERTFFTVPWDSTAYAYETSEYGIILYTEREHYRHTNNIWSFRTKSDDNSKIALAPFHVYCCDDVGYCKVHMDVYIVPSGS